MDSTTTISGCPHDPMAAKEGVGPAFWIGPSSVGW